jgi:hypothetical protein
MCALQATGMFDAIDTSKDRHPLEHSYRFFFMTNSDAEDGSNMDSTADDLFSTGSNIFSCFLNCYLASDLCSQAALGLSSSFGKSIVVACLGSKGKRAIMLNSSKLKSIRMRIVSATVHANGRKREMCGA